MHLIEQHHKYELHNLYKESKETISQWIPMVEQIISNIEILEELIDFWLDLFSKGKGYCLAIRYDGKMCGFISLVINKDNFSGDFGIWLHSDFKYSIKKAGYLCTKKILDVAFNEYNFIRINAYCALDNDNVHKVVEKLGFIKEGVKRCGEVVNDKIYDQVCYGLLKSEYDNLNV